MNAKKYIFSKSFFKILIIIILSQSLIFSLFSVIYYNIARNNIIETLEDKHKNIAYYIGLQIENTNKTVENFCVTQFLNPNMKQLMYQEEVDNFYTITNINKLHAITNSVSYVKSFVIYNGILNQYYESGRYGWQATHELKEKLINGELLYLKPVTNIMENGAIGLSYAMYETDESGKISAALIVNAGIEWLDDVLKESYNEGTNLYVINQETGEIIIGEPKNMESFQHIINSNENYEQDLYKNIDNKASYINVTSISNTGWLLVYEQPYTIAFGALESFKANLMSVIFIVLVFSLIVSWMIANWIYNPFRRLYNLAVKTSEKNEVKNEVLYLENIFKLNQNRIIQLDTYKSNTQEIINRNILMNLITEYEETNILRINEYENIKSSAFFLKGPWILISIQIDFFEDLSLSIGEKHIKNIREIIAKTIDEKIMREYDVKWIYIGNGEYILFINLSKQSVEYMIIINSFSIYKDIINSSITKATVSVFVDQSVNELKDLRTSYYNIKKMYEYKIFYGRKCLISFQEIEKRQSNKLSYPDSKAFMEALKDGDKDRVKEEYQKWSNAATAGSVEYFVFHNSKLLINMNQAIREFEWFRDRITFNVQDLFREIMVANTKLEIDEKLESIFNVICDTKQEHEDKTKTTKDILIESIKEYILINYWDDNLSLKTIANEFGLSSVYFGNKFKKSEGTSISNYIHQIRLKHFVDQLENTNKPIKEVMEDVGYQNESNFYKIFKAEYGITPKEFKNILIRKKIEENL